MQRNVQPDQDGTNRRKFLQYLATLAVGTRALLRPGRARADEPSAEGFTTELPRMTYRKLGRTDFNASRLLFGCGAALSRGPRDDLLNAALDAGINVFDVGFRGYYRDAEMNLGPFIRKVRDRVFLISKATVLPDVEPDVEITAAQAKEAATGWSAAIDGSLREMGVDHIDAYYLMASHNTSIIASDEMYEAFLQAKKAGKISYLGLSTHRNAQRVLDTAAETGRYDLAMIAITPAGWYDWDSKGLLKGTERMTRLRPVLDRARKAGIGLVGMKAGRYIAGRKFLGWGNPKVYDQYYDEKLMQSGLSAFQRSYAYVLEHGLDVVNADMQSFAHLQENLIAAATSKQYFA